MAVYVDESVHPFRGMVMCHMLADTLEELHAMASKVGMRRDWFQDKRTPHYDLCKAKRALAVAFGAIECDRHQITNVSRRLRGEPEIPGAKPLPTAAPVQAVFTL